MHKPGSRENFLLTRAPSLPLYSAQDKESWELSDGEKIEHAKAKKEKGNVLYKQGKYLRAANKYNKVGIACTDNGLKVGFPVSSSGPAVQMKGVCIASWAYAWGWPTSTTGWVFMRVTLHWFSRGFSRAASCS